jgi:putative transcriptional regulator
MSAGEIEASAARDRDNPPLTDAPAGKLRRIPRVKTLRRALALTQEEFAARFRIPLGTLRDWEQGRSEPDQPAKAYLTVIARDPQGVERALHPPRSEQTDFHAYRESLRGWRRHCL